MERVALGGLVLDGVLDLLAYFFVRLKGAFELGLEVLDVLLDLFDVGVVISLPLVVDRVVVRVL